MPLKEVRKILIFTLILFTVFTGCFLFFSQTAQALGISPPWVKVPNLLRGSHYEKNIAIVQGDPKEPLRAEVQFIASEELKKWISIKQGTEFTIPQVKQFPVTVVIDVPPTASLGRYTGEILITTSPQKQEGTQVTIGIGVVIELDLTVVEEESVDWSVPLQEILAMEEGWPVKISFTIDNKGNGKARPKKVVLEVYRDIRGGRLVGTYEDADLLYVESFTRGATIAEFPMDLTVDRYWAKITLYKNDNEKLEYEAPFEVLPRGTLPSEKPWLKWFLTGLGAVVFLAVLVWCWRRCGRKILNLFSLVTRLRPSIKIKKKKIAAKKKVEAVKKKIKKRKKKVKEAEEAPKEDNLGI